VMETGYDIIFFWVARMMMLGEWLTGREPFSVVYLHGMVRDPYGAKMSKTLGNVVDPLGVIREIGADALRFALINGTTPGADQRLGESRLEGARNFGNKLWNAARFVLGARPDAVPDAAPLSLPDRALLGPAEHWILDRCAVTVTEVEAAYGSFQLGEATRLLHEAIWSDYCDWYLEIAKVNLSNEAAPAEERVATWQVLVWVLDRYLRLLHPIMPFLTEAIWQRLPHLPSDPDQLIIADWPSGAMEAGAADRPEAVGTQALIDLVRQVRAARAEAGIEPGEWLEARLWLHDRPAGLAFERLGDAVARLARIRPQAVESREALDAGLEGALVAIAGDNEARLLRSGGDLERERARLVRELERAQFQLAQAEARLADANFTSRAPAHVVDGARRRAEELREAVARLAARVAG
ncbi:MAG TPA: class I tRNA ligase family protein, partial [Candidatus Limnocylindrales bacterium]|nr:class I tRNA ligase family protein [Candidatus Limnocylindrales bacterium]